MPAPLGPARETVPQESIARVELFTEAKTPKDRWEVRYHWESGNYVDGVLDGDTKFGSRPAVTRLFEDIQNDSYTAAGVTVTAEQLAALIQVAGYKYRQQDIDAAASAAQQGAGNAG